MDSAILSASAGLIGSLIGGMSTFAASWLTQRQVLRTQTLMQNAMQRQAIYSDFIIEASKRLTEAWSHKAEGPEVIAGLYSAVARMRLTASSEIIKRAEQVILGIIAAYADPNRMRARGAPTRRRRSAEATHIQVVSRATRDQADPPAGWAALRQFRFWGERSIMRPPRRRARAGF